MKAREAFSIATTVDFLGFTKAAIAGQEEQVEGYKAVLIEAAANETDRAFEGQFFRATVSFSNRSVTDWRNLIHELIEGSDDATRRRISGLIIKHTQTVEGLPTVRVSARKEGV